MMHRLYVFLVLVLTLAGCGGGSMAPSAKSASYYGSSPTASSSGASYSEASGGMDAPSPPPPSIEAQGGRVAHEESRPEPNPQTRPGLGTEFGESRSSHVRDVSFARANGDNPFAVATLHYNDRQGVLALAQFHADRSPDFREIPSAGGAITVSIHDESGRALEGFHVGDRNYVVGQQGQRYSVNIINHTGHRFEVVGTVDGLDVINGRDGSLQNRGYMLMPYATLDIVGFRQSHDSVAAFRFASVRDSYAAQTGSARNVGVIGVAFFAEAGDQITPYTSDELHTRDTASPFPGVDTRFAQPPPR